MAQSRPAMRAANKRDDSQNGLFDEFDV